MRQLQTLISYSFKSVNTEQNDGLIGRKIYSNLSENLLLPTEKNTNDYELIIGYFENYKADIDKYSIQTVDQ